MNDFYCINLESLVEYHDNVSDIKSYINSKRFSDFQIKNKEGDFYCHSQLFFHRIPCEDIAKSNMLLNIHNKSQNVLDLSYLNIRSSTILNFLEMLYLGNFINHHQSSDFYDLLKIFEIFNLKRLRNSIINHLKQQLLNAPSSLPNSEVINILKNKTFLVLNDNRPVFGANKSNKNPSLQKNTMNYLKLCMSFRCNSLSIMLSESQGYRHHKNPKVLNLPSSTLFHIYTFIACDQLPLLYNDLSVYVDLLFFADYLCFNSLFAVIYHLNQKLESQLIFYVSEANFVMMIIIAFFCNSQTVFDRCVEVMIRW